MDISREAAQARPLNRLLSTFLRADSEQQSCAPIESDQRHGACGGLTIFLPFPASLSPISSPSSIVRISPTDPRHKLEYTALSFPGAEKLGMDEVSALCLFQFVLH